MNLVALSVVLLAFAVSRLLDGGAKVIRTARNPTTTGDHYEERDLVFIQADLSSASGYAKVVNVMMVERFQLSDRFTN
jgi:hypothetical protein